LAVERRRPERFAGDRFAADLFPDDEALDLAEPARFDAPLARLDRFEADRLLREPFGRPGPRRPVVPGAASTEAGLRPRFGVRAFFVTSRRSASQRSFTRLRSPARIATDVVAGRPQTSHTRMMRSAMYLLRSIRMNGGCYVNPSIDELCLRSASFRVPERRRGSVHCGRGVERRR
jgi:hypothetical protein